jgi:hypothetical protein
VVCRYEKGYYVCFCAGVKNDLDIGLGKWLSVQSRYFGARYLQSRRSKYGIG